MICSSDFGSTACLCLISVRRQQKRSLAEIVFGLSLSYAFSSMLSLGLCDLAGSLTI